MIVGVTKKYVLTVVKKERMGNESGLWNALRGLAFVDSGTKRNAEGLPLKLKLLQLNSFHPNCPPYHQPSYKKLKVNKAKWQQKQTKSLLRFLEQYFLF